MRNFFTSILMFALSVLVIGTSLLSPVFVHGQPFLPEDSIDEADNFDPSFGINDLTNGQDTDLPAGQDVSPASSAPAGTFSSGASQSSLPECGILPTEAGTIEGCFIRILYYGVLYPSAFLAGIGGTVFDYLTAYTLNSNSYAGGPESFIEQGWRVLRDLANVSFIFILLYSAIRFILGLDSQSIGKTVARIILVALVINFSLFATRVIVDAGNILGRVFYESIEITNDVQGDQTGRKSISVGLISLFNPQRLLTSDMFTSYANQSQMTLNQVGGQNTIGNAVNDVSPSNGFIILILLIASAMNLLIAYVFFSVGIFLIARTAGLWIMMIMSPLAFASIGIPALKGKMGKFGFDGWLSQTISLSFLVVVFLFFLYLTVMFLQIAFNSITSTILGGGMENASVIQIIMSVVIPFAIVFFLMTQAKSQAKQMAGDFGSMAVKGLKMAVVGALGTAGLALGVTAGVAAIAGRQVVGRAAAGAAAKADTTTARGRFVKKYGTALANQNFDARNIKIPKPVSSRLRSGLSYATGGEVSASDFRLTNMRKGSQKSYSKLFEEKTKKKVEKAKMYAPDESTKVGVVDANGKPISVKEAQKNLDRRRIDAKQANDYDEKIKSRDKQKKVVDDVRRDYNTAIQDFRDGRLTQIEFGSIKRALDSAKKAHEDKVNEVKGIEDIWKSEETVYNNAKKALAKKKTDFFKNYAKEVDSWAAFPDAMLTHRYDANRAASSKIEDLGIAEEKKEEKKAEKEEKKADS